MSDGPTLDNLDVADFTVGAMLRTGLAVRQVVRGAASLEQAADMIVRYLHGSCIDPATRQRTLALVRFYKTHSFGGLEPELQRFVAAQLGDIPISDDMRCLALLATIGDEPAWNSRHESRSHKAIALPSAEIVRAAPMIARLLEEMGLDIESVVSGGTPTMRGGAARTYNVFHVEHALGSPHIPAQREFVERYDIASVVGFGGLLRSGELYAVIFFSRVTVPPESAARFRTIALDIRSALYNVDESNTWAARSS